VASVRFAVAQLARFTWLEARSCAFAVTLFAGLAVSTVVELPIPRYDALLLYGLAVTLLYWRVGLETGREVAVIAIFHLIGLVFELVKVRLGSWSYPEPALTKVGGVPLYSGFLYAAVGSYICRAWRLLDLRLSNYHALATGLVSAAIYLNFITHHWLPDLRWPLAVLLVATTGNAWVHFAVGRRRYRMPLAASFVLIGFFLWVAENVATFLGAWSYPYQLDAWQPVHASKFGAWALLVSVSFTLIASWQARAGSYQKDLSHAVGFRPSAGCAAARPPARGTGSCRNAACRRACLTSGARCPCPGG
jgi:uncharacterized membrane protein YoaT (DUF817 family)